LLEGASKDFQTPEAASWDFPEDGIISDSPDTPAHNDNYLHEESLTNLASEIFKFLNHVRRAGH